MRSATAVAEAACIPGMTCVVQRPLLLPQQSPLALRSTYTSGIVVDLAKPHATVKRMLVVAVCSLVVAGCGSGSYSSSTATPQDPAAKAAQELASHEPGDDPSQFQSVLTALKPVCREGPETLAGQIFASWEDLKKTTGRRRCST